jgi:PAS domain-containing protein
MVRTTLARSSRPEKRAAALRLLGRHALAEAPKLLEKRVGDRSPVVAAGALDGLWLCAPDGARAASEPLELRVAQALAGEEESQAAGPLAVLSLVEYDAASRRRAREAAGEIGKRGRAALRAAEALVAAGDRDGARAAFASAAKRFSGFPVGEEARAALGALGPAPGGR